MFLNKTSKYQNIIKIRFYQVLIVSIFLILAPIKLYGEEISTSEVKASWIYTIIDWLDWKGRPKNEKSIICTIGRDKVFMYLKRMEMKDNNKKGKLFFVQNKAPSDDLKECNILYISDSEQEYYMNILEKINTAHKGVIAISSIDGFARHGGSIEFVIKKKARLIINLKTVKNAKVTIDDELYGWVETIN